MPYLIDGHNLVAQTPGLSLADPDDEAKLAALVRRFCARQRRKAALIFDRGLPGGPSALSNGDVAVFFASDRHTTADDLLLNRIRDEKNPGGMIVVSSDQRIVQAARARRMTVLSSSEFGRQLANLSKTAKTAAKEEGLTGDSLADWEALFSSKKPD